MLYTIAPSFTGITPIGILSVSLKCMNLSARPSLSVSSRIVSLSLPFEVEAAKGYSKDCVTQSLPRASKAILIGLPIWGSEANSVISKPSGSLKPFFFFGAAGRSRTHVLFKCRTAVFSGSRLVIGRVAIATGYKNRSMAVITVCMLLMI